MSKILNTQLTGIFNRLEKQALDIQMAAQCLIQAIGGEGYVYIKGYGDLKFYEAFVLDSEEKLDTSRSLERLNSYEEIDSTDRVFLFAPFYTEDYDKIVQPHPMAFNYVYYEIYTQMIEMTRDLEL